MCLKDDADGMEYKGITLKFLNFRTPENCCNLPKTQTKRPNPRVFRQTDANGIANSEDPDQTASRGAVCSLIWVCTVCP